MKYRSANKQARKRREERIKREAEKSIAEVKSHKKHNQC